MTPSRDGPRDRTGPAPDAPPGGAGIPDPVGTSADPVPFETAPDVVVLGMGNVLIGDDAFGPHVVRMLDAAYDFEPEVAVLDVGTPGLDLTPYIGGSRALVVVDTVSVDGPRGRIHRYTEDHLLEQPPVPRIGPHDPGLEDALFTLELSGRAPEDVVLLGVTPEKTETGIGLSPAVQEAVPWAVAAVLKELKRLGRPARPRPQPDEPEIWWEQRARA